MSNLQQVNNQISNSNQNNNTGASDNNNNNFNSKNSQSSQAQVHMPKICNYKFVPTISFKMQLEKRDVNIITGEKTKEYGNIPKFRRLGQCKDFPYPKNNMNCDERIDKNIYQIKQIPGARSIRSISEMPAQNQVRQPFFLLNCSSTNYNFINNTVNENQQNRQFKQVIQQPKVAFITKREIQKYLDTNRVSCVNRNPIFLERESKGQNLNFRVRYGEFTQDYELAHKYGPGAKPFKHFK